MPDFGQFLVKQKIDSIKKGELMKRRRRRTQVILEKSGLRQLDNGSRSRSKSAETAGEQ
jgi:hypothetical protein